MAVMVKTLTEQNKATIEMIKKLNMIKMKLQVFATLLIGKR